MLIPISWLKEYVNTRLSTRELAERITMGGVEVEEVIGAGASAVLNLAPTPNRGDCLSVIGVAREVSALTGCKLKFPQCTSPKGIGKMRKWVEIVVGDKKAVPRYTSRVIDGVRVCPSPRWLRKRVEAVGIRSINNIVDATNFVLMELGQPVHAFDLRFLKGGRLVIDRPKRETKMVALDGREYTFTPEDILNLDNERAVGAAGIMGAENSGVVADTTTLVLESAYFDPISVRRTSKRTGLVSESSKRFEKGVDPEGVVMALHRLTHLILDIAGGTPSEDWVDYYPKPFKPLSLEITIEHVNHLLGTGLTPRTVARILKSLGCKVSLHGSGRFSVTVPTYRPDLMRPVDLIEEVARLYGYDNIKESLPAVRIAPVVLPPAKETEQIARDALVGMGFFEAVTYSFASELNIERFGGGQPMRLVNPITADMVAMRTSLVPSLLGALRYNLNRQHSDVRLFEIGRVFLAKKGKSLPDERLCLAGAMTGLGLPGNFEGAKDCVDLLDAKAALWSVFARLGLPWPDVALADEVEFLHPADSFKIILQGEVVGFCGGLHPRLMKEYEFGLPVYIFEVNFDILKRVYLSKKIVYRPISRFPVSIRDVAMLVDSVVTHEEIVHGFSKNLNKLVQSIELFDIYEGKGIPEGKKSMAYRLTFGSDERTLSDEEVDIAFGDIVGKVTAELKATIR